MITAELLIPATVVFAIGAVIQGGVGFGGNLFAAPILVVIEPNLLPEPILIGAFALNLLMVRRERVHAGLGPLSWALGGRVVGTLAGVAILVWVPADGLALLFGVAILAAVATSAAGWHLERTRNTLAGAGAVSGMTATAFGVGGPPIALVYQRDEGPMLRGSVARFFVAGQIVSLGMLAAFGQIDSGEWLAGFALMPGAAVGFALSGRVAGWLDAGRTRSAVLTVASVSAVITIVRALA